MRLSVRYISPEKSILSTYNSRASGKVQDRADAEYKRAANVTWGVRSPSMTPRSGTTSQDGKHFCTKHPNYQAFRLYRLTRTSDNCSGTQRRLNHPVPQGLEHQSGIASAHGVIRSGGLPGGGIQVDLCNHPMGNL